MDNNFLSQELNPRSPALIPESIVQNADPLKLDLPEATFINVINKRISDSQAWFNSKKNLSARRQLNKDYYFGRQLPKLKSYSAKYVDNIIWQAENTIKPIAMSRLPDLIVKPGNVSEESKVHAKDLTAVMNSDIRKRQNRQVLGLAFKMLPIQYVGIIKAYWNPEKGQHGDYEFRAVNPENVVVDHTATSNDPDQMEFIAESIEMSYKEIMMRFPKTADKFVSSMVSLGRLDPSAPNYETQLATKITIWEVWFDWWEKKDGKETKITGVAWKYQNFLLGKMKHPYWDWRGKTQLAGNPSMEEMQMAMMTGQQLPTETVYYNFLDNPSKPYIFLGYEQWGEMPYDETSRIEQVIYLQDNVNKRGRQITEMNDRAKGKHVFSTLSGLTKTDVEAMDLDNPDKDIVVNGNLGDVHTFINGTPANPGLYSELSQDREKVFSAMGTNSTTRGERSGGSDETATGRQILRESDFGRIDDLVEDTVNSSAEQMARWAMQFIKLFYTEEHMRSLVGATGEATIKAISRDIVEDGMEVEVSASGVDRLMAKREAFERAKMQLTDPLTFFSDIQASDPVGRTEKLILFKMSPELYYKKFVQKMDLQGMAMQLGQAPVPTPQPVIQQ